MKKSRDAPHLPLTASLPYNPRLLTRDVWQTMIKILRFANEKYPWFLAITMGFIAVSFIVGMGWWGFGEHSGSVVATVGDLSISLDEFKRAYENTYRFYKEKVPGEFKDETIKHYVVEQLVDNRVWLIAAHNLRLTVSEDDLRESILQIPEFQRNGRFDPEHYQRLLAANHLTPSMFEATQAKELLSLKARIMVSDAVALTPAELAEAQALTLRQPDSDPAKAAAAKERAVQDVLFQKQQRTLVAYAQSLKATLPITIKRELL
jgi:SurA-like protein